MQGMQQDDSSDRRMIDDKFQMLLLAFAAAPALVELHMQLPDHLAIASQSLVSDIAIVARCLSSLESTCRTASAATTDPVARGNHSASKHTALGSCRLM